MKSVKEIIKKHQSGTVCIKGYFYVLSGESIKAFISDEKEFNKDDPAILLPINVVDLVISQDEILGVLVGGTYLYYSVQVEIEGDINFNKDDVYFEKIHRLVLFNNGISQTIN